MIKKNKAKIDLVQAAKDEAYAARKKESEWAIWTGDNINIYQHYLNVWGRSRLDTDRYIMIKSGLMILGLVTVIRPVDSLSFYIHTSALFFFITAMGLVLLIIRWDSKIIENAISSLRLEGEERDAVYDIALNNRSRMAGKILFKLFMAGLILTGLLGVYMVGYHGY